MTSSNSPLFSVFVRVFASFLLTSLLLPLQAERDRAKARAWPHESSDIPVNPRLAFGTLDNGMRYAWMSNREPDKRSYLRLHLSVGSLAEEDDERGMAHFLEHMAFNGSENFPPGTLVEWFQEHGMSFGADTNASTGFEATVYQLDLPDSDAGTLGEGLKVFRDFADRLLLEPGEIEAEKGVVDAEQRERDSASLRTFVKQIEIELKGTRVPKRLPIGVQEVRAEFTPAMVRAFYREWYRPENATLIVVGDLEEFDPGPLIRESFADWKPPESPPSEAPPVGEPAFEERCYAIHEEEIPTARIALEMLKPYQEEPDTKARRIEDLPLSLARGMLNLRYSEMAKEEDAPFLNASVRSSSVLEVIEGQNLTVVTAPDQWKEGLAKAERELRRALKFGFQQAELDEVRANVKRSLDEAVEREKTRHSLGFVRELLSAAEDGSVVSDAETDRAIILPALEKLTVEQCGEAFSKAWKEGTQQLSLVGNVDLGDEASKILREALAESRKSEVEPPEAITVAAFAYHSSPDEKGEIAKREHVEDLDVHLVEFANGVRLNIKKTDFKERQILVAGRLGKGMLTLDKNRPELSLVASQVFSAGGLQAHSADELRRLTAGKQVGTGFSVGQGAFNLRGSTTSEDLLLQCELMAAYLTHPGWRPEGMNQFKAVVPRLYEGLRHQHQGPLRTEFIPKIYEGDARFGIPPREKVESVTMEEVRAWLEPRLGKDPLELTFVGDLEVEKVVQAAARTFGRLPERQPEKGEAAYLDNMDVPSPRPGLDESYQIETRVPKSLLYMAFPTTDGRQSDTRRRLFFLSQIIDDRLRKEVREKLGSAYSPSASSQTNRVFPGVGLMVIQSMSDPEKVSELRQACLAVTEDLATNGVAAEEVGRLKQPVLAQVRDTRRTNGYWLSALDESQSRPEALQEIRDLTSFYENLKASDITPLATTYLPKERASVAIVSPR